MVDKIADILKDLAREHEITILYAVESGSRAWGFESNDSDYGKAFIQVI
jgi:predicted nucleotidyltransferase